MSNRAHIVAGALCAAGLTFPLAACKPSPKAAQEGNAAQATSAKAKGPKLSPAAAKAALGALRNEALVERAKVVSMANNHESNASSLRKYEREANEVRLFQRVPLSPSLDELRGSLTTALGALSLRPTDLMMKPRDATRRPLPPSLPEGPRFEPLREDIRGTIDVAFTLPGVASPRLDEVLRKLGDMIRLFYPVRAKETPAGMRLEGEAYWFYEDFRVPPMKARSRDLAADLASKGIETGALAGDAEAQRWLDELGGDYREMAARKADHEKALEQQRELVRFDARMRFAHDRAAEAGDRTAERVLGEK